MTQFIDTNPETGTAYVMCVSNRGTSFLASSVLKENIVNICIKKTFGTLVVLCKSLQNTFQSYINQTIVATDKLK